MSVLVPLDPTTFGSYVGLAIAVLGALAAAYGILKYKIERAYRGEQNVAYDDLLRVANGRKELISDLERQKTDMSAKLVQEQQKLVDCNDTLNAATRHNLRLQARNEQYERCINRLERELKIEPTQFDKFSEAYEQNH
jgi:DNA repair exonuclease SbcCD ATPase subunit